MAVDNEAFMSTLQTKELWQAAFQSNTFSLTTLKGSSKVNVVPATAELELDCRLLTDQIPRQLLSELVTIINDDSIEITGIMGFKPVISTTDTPFMKP